MRLGRILTVIFVIFFAFGSEILADTKVVTYVVKTQDKRESTRWTLTEWLRIKERMKMMDVWLAMFSNPTADKFSPEVQFSYTGLQVRPKLSKGELSLGEYKVTSELGTLDLWMTNLFTGVTGLHLLNIDLGVLAALRGANKYQSPVNQVQGAAQASKFARSHYGLALRVFGKNVQDSSLSLSYGDYEWVPRSWLRGDESVFDGALNGQQVSVGLRLYLTKVIGIEANGTRYLEATSGSNSWRGQSLSYAAFVEVSLLKVFFGSSAEQWRLRQGSDSLIYDIDEKGYYTGLAMSL